MVFNSFQFIWLFPLIFIVYWLAYSINKKGFTISKYLLLAISYGVYIQWSVMFGVILLLITLLTYASALIISRQEKHRKAWIWTTSLLSLSPLLLFKYFNFITGAGASALQWVGIDAAPPALSWVVPLGLSFYTFQALGYLFDVYRKKINAETNVWDYMLFVSFFPQILCGPISTAETLLPQIKNPKPFDFATATSGLRMILWGLFLKVVLADRAGLYVDIVYSNYLNFSGTTSLLASIMYSIQIYGDFAGYSYMAIGSARLLGIHLPMNFNRPYFAESVSGFWKRWNMSLTRWLTTNIYIPLGGSRKGSFRTYVNIIVTFLVSGIWHGANWTFIFWGLLHGIAQVFEKALNLNKKVSYGFVRVIRCLITFVFVNFAWIYFRMPSIDDANTVISRIFTNIGGLYLDMTTLTYFIIALAIVFIVEFVMEFRRNNFNSLLMNHKIIRWSAYVVLTLMILGIGVLDSSQFIYIQF